MTIGRIPSVEGGIQPTIVDAKGDILTATAADTPAVLAVGNNGETLVADSSATTGLRWQGNFAAGKNAILNGDFTINQRAFTSVTANGTYTFDRFVTNNSGGTVTFTPQTFTPGSAPVAGYEATNFLQIVTSGQSSTNYAGIGQKIEDVRTFAGQTVTLSFWAKATSGTPRIGWYAVQYFGTGGSASVAAYAGYTGNISTSWARYSITYSVPSVSGKTIGTSSAFENYLMVSDGAGTQGIQNNTFQIWGVQLEPGSVATGFETATGTLAGELAACQRYFQTYGGSVYAPFVGQFYQTTNARFTKPFITQLRTGSPTVTFPSSPFTNFVEDVGVANRTPTGLATDQVTSTHLTFTASGMSSCTLYNMAVWTTSGTAITISAEL